MCESRVYFTEFFFQFLYRVNMKRKLEEDSVTIPADEIERVLKLPQTISFKEFLKKRRVKVWF